MDVDEEPWRQFTRWLRRLNLPPSFARLTWPSATLKDVFLDLRDGVLLCYIAAAIDFNSVNIKEVNEGKMLVQFLCLKNIRQFLTACRSNFGLGDRDLFEPAMLYDGTNFVKVLKCLSRVSLSHAAKRQNIVGFPENGKDLKFADKKPYLALEFALSRPNEDNDAADNNEHYSEPHHYFSIVEDKEEEIYHDLCSLKASTLKRRQSELEFKTEEKRDYCIKELVESEGKYVDVLNAIVKQFAEKLTTMTEDDRGKVFMNVAELRRFHVGFYEDLLGAVSGTNQMTIGDVFWDHKSEFLLYGDYCSKLSACHGLLDTLTAHYAGLREELSKLEREANGGQFKLSDLVTVPMQRILKYHLLLRELLSRTSEEHEEYESIKEAYEMMLDVSGFINEAKRDSEQLRAIRQIQKSVRGWSFPPGMELSDYGRVRKDGLLKVVFPGDAPWRSAIATLQYVYVFLFDKAIVVGKIAASRSSGVTYAFKSAFKLSTFKLQDVERKAWWGFPFQLVNAAKPVEVYTLFAKSEEERAEWISKVKVAFDNISPACNSSHNLYMYTLKQPTLCTNCRLLLKGLFYQGYRCQDCGAILHKECTAQITCTPINDAEFDRPSSLLPEKVYDPLVHRMSSVSVDSVDNAVMRPPSPKAAPVSPEREFTTPLGEQLEAQPWFFAELTKETAAEKMRPCPPNTFAVRKRQSSASLTDENYEFALSLKAEIGSNISVRHVKIYKDEATQEFYISERHKFNSIADLVRHFSEAGALEVAFHAAGVGQSVKLEYPLGSIASGAVQTRLAFNPNPTDKRFLSVDAGERLTLVDDSKDAQGWWKVYNGKAVGYVPKDLFYPR